MQLTRSFWWALASLLLMVIGAVGPWAKVLGITIDGTDDGKDGWIVLVAAIIAGVVVLIQVLTHRRWLAVVPLLAGLVGGATAAYDVSDINSLASGSLGGVLVSTEWGIYIALIGSVSLALAAIGLFIETKRRAPVAPSSG